MNTRDPFIGAFRVGVSCDKLLPINNMDVPINVFFVTEDCGQHFSGSGLYY